MRSRPAVVVFDHSCLQNLAVAVALQADSLASESHSGRTQEVHNHTAAAAAVAVAVVAASGQIVLDTEVFEAQSRVEEAWQRSWRLRRSTVSAESSRNACFCSPVRKEGRGGAAAKVMAPFFRACAANNLSASVPCRSPAESFLKAYCTDTALFIKNCPSMLSIA